MRWNIPAKLTDLTSAGEQELGQLMAYRKSSGGGEDMPPSAEWWLHGGGSGGGTR